MALVVRAPAKVNLGLRVLGRRPDGYHELDTLFHALELSDELLVDRAASGIDLQVSWAEDAPAGELGGGPDNLVHRAAQLFLAASGARGGARLHLHKRIPMGAGLGGGSSDAAAALRLLNRLHGAPLAAEALHDLAVRLGADVPFFLAGGSQRGRGRGEILTPEPSPDLHFLLLLPPFGTSTAAVYKNHPAQLIVGAEKASIPDDKAIPSKGLAMPDCRQNDLESAAMGLYPQLLRLREQIVAAGCPTVCMSGSGSTLFLASETEAAVVEAQSRVGFLADEGVRLLRTHTAGAGDRAPREVPWSDRPRGGNQGGRP